MVDTVEIRAASPADAAAVVAIYNHYVAESIATFEIKAVSTPVMGRRIEAVTRTHPWLVAVGDRRLLGYAYATRWKERAAYARSAEATIYLAPDQCGAGLGRRLYGRLLERLWAAGVHTVLAGIALPNPASVALHEALGFRKVAHLDEVGWKFERWVDVGYWQVNL